MISILLILAAAYGSAALIGIAIVLSRTKFQFQEVVRFFSKRSSLRLFQTTLFVFLFLILVFIFLSKIFPGLADGSWISSDNPSALIIMLSGVLATIGWIFSVHSQERNLAKEHAYRLIERSMTDPIIVAHKNNVMCKYPLGKNISEEQVTTLRKELENCANYGKKKMPVLHSIIQILNVYEAMATGIRTDKLDEDIIKDFVGAIIRNSCTKKFRAVVIWYRKRGADGLRPTSYEDLVWLLKRWYGLDLDDPSYQ